MEFINCPCSGANLPRFVQPVVLAILHNGPLHGYLVAQRLAETVLFRKQPPDTTGIYRVLKNMEQEELLLSDWELGDSSGPARKRYELTEKGRHCLAQWSRTLEAHQSFIADLLHFLEESRAESPRSDAEQEEAASFSLSGPEHPASRAEHDS